MMKSKLRVSLVIPAYNEESHLHAALQAVAAQTVKPFEVIVVDNNSSDGTAAIARAFPFVKLLQQPKQGVVHARNMGFDAARGDIIGRLDGDAILAPDWVESVQKVFARQEVAAATGRMRYHTITAANLCSAIDLRVRRWLARKLGREVAIQGANSAIRRSVWLQVRSSLCCKRGLHEDFDLAVHVNRAKCLVVFDESMLATIAHRITAASWPNFVRYALQAPRSYEMHGLYRSARYMYAAVALVMVLYLPIRILRKGYCESTGGFSFRQLFMFSCLEKRVNPATFGDFSS